MIKVNGLNKYYNKGRSSEIHVINNTSLELPSTGLITFLGHSGSGKTTLLNVIGGLDKAKGQIIYDDVEFNRYAPYRLDKFRSNNIGYVFQNYNLLLEETVYDNLRIALELIGITDLEEQQKRIEHSLKAVGMYKYRKKGAAFLSGGQQQRVSIARALIKKSKVIIADEPTGNLDSKNTVEVMNILKKISKQALVLLVTHEENVANFYSDVIYEVKDGSIVDTRTVSDNEVFHNTDDTTIYLKDLNENEYTSEFGTTTIHSYDNEDLKVDFNIIIKNGTVYLSSNRPVKLIEQSNLKIVNDHKKEIKREDLDSLNYDNSWFNDSVKGERKFFKKALTRISNSFISFKAVGRKQKFLYFCLGLIGALVGIAFCLLSNAVSFDLSKTPYSTKINTIYNYGSVSSNSVLSKAIEAGQIGDVIPLNTTYIYYNEQITYRYGINEIFTCYGMPYFSNSVNLVMGEEPKENEVVLSYDVISKIASKTKRDVKEYLGKTISLSWGEKKISGFSQGDNLMVYLNKSDYELVTKPKNTDYYQSERRYTYSFGNNEFYSDYDLRYYEYETYQITEGRDINKDATGIEVLVPENSKYDLDSMISFDSSSVNYATVVGKYKTENVKDHDIFYLSKKFEYYLSSFLDLAPVFENSSNIGIAEGRYPSKPKEVLASVYGNHKIGDTVNWNYKVVGLFYGDPRFTECYLCSFSTVALDSYVTGAYIFDIKDAKGFNEILSENNMKLVSTFDYNANLKKKAQQEFVNYFLYVFIGTTVVAAIFIYFIMRSKMINDIYSIGVYRSLGAYRSRIDIKYLSDIFILTTFTGLIGYFFGVIGYFSFLSSVNSITSAILNTDILMLNWGIASLGILALYAIMSLFGMLPILFLQLKTPSEIIAKYDI